MEFVVIWCLMGVVSGMIAAGKGADPILYGVLGFVLGPIGIILACVAKGSDDK